MAKDPRISKLPKWARGYIAQLEQERNDARKALFQFTDLVTPTPFSFETYVSVEKPEQSSYLKGYVHTDMLKVTYMGVELTIICSKDRRGIELTWHSDAGPALVDSAVVLQPTSTNQCRLYNLYHRLYTTEWAKSDYQFWVKKHEEAKAKKPGGKGKSDGKETTWDGSEAPDFANKEGDPD